MCRTRLAIPTLNARTLGARRVHVAGVPFLMLDSDSRRFMFRIEFFEVGVRKMV